jgi:hypothetical protein
MTNEPREPQAPKPSPEDDEVLDVGQEEVFSRTEVELGAIEHATVAGAPADAPVSIDEAAKRPPTRQGGADAGQTADDPGRGGD